MRSRLKQILLPIISQSPRLRWNLASFSKRKALQAVCATSEEREAAQLGRIDAQRVAQMLGKSSVVLDLGCGIGRVESSLWRHCREIYAVDVSDRMLTLSKRRLAGIPNIKLLRLNGTDLHVFQENMFDLCFSFHCLQHMEKEDAYLALREIHRVLNLGGIAYLHFPDLTSETYFSLFKSTEHRRDKSRVRAYTMPELKKIVSDLGFSIVNEEHTCLNPYVEPAELDRDILLTLAKKG